MAEFLESLVGALVGAFLGAYAAVSATISTARLSRAESLRDDFASFFGKSSELHKSIKNYRGRGLEIPWATGDELRVIDWKIRLMLDQHDPYQQRLSQLMNNFVQHILQIEDNVFYKERREIFLVAQDFLRQEWERAKPFGAVRSKLRAGVRRVRALLRPQQQP